MLEHNVAYDPAAVMPRLMRDYAVLSHVPAILTLIDFQVRRRLRMALPHGYVVSSGWRAWMRA
jgi:hypothetical protein